MKFNSFYLLIFVLLFLQINSSLKKRNLQSTSDDEITDGTYLIKNFDGNLNLKIIDNTLYFSSNEDKQKFNKYLIYEKKNKTKSPHGYENYGDDDDDREKYYYIEEKSTKKKLYYDDATSSIMLSDKINPGDDDKFLWELNLKKYKNNLDYFEIKAKTKTSFISYEESDKELSKIYCENSWTALSNDRKTKFRLIKLYRENLSINPKSSLLEKEPIDVVIKYIDLNDTSLDRKKFEQINKDKQNNELKYSLRSILKNIPWVRKIFIVMPNEKIPYLKDKEEIKDRIVYIKDKELLGFDSSSPPTFQFNIDKLEKYNLSENFILMDDDYFIGQPLQKSDLFYEEKGKIYPYIISTEYSELDESDQRMQYTTGLSNIKNINYHSEEGFNFRKASSFVFLFKIFDLKDNLPNTLIEVGFTHNAIPLKISDVKEVNENIQKYYQYYVNCLTGKNRNMRSLQPQILFMNYARNVYDRLVNEISWKYYDLSDVRQVKLDTKLFVVNVEDKEYYPLRYQTEEEVLKNLFPEPTKYEKEYNNKISPNQNEIKISSTNDKEKDKDKDKDKEKEIKIRDINVNVKKNDDNNNSNDGKDKEKDNKSFDLNDLYNKIKEIVNKKEDNNEEKIEKNDKNDKNQKISTINNLNDNKQESTPNTNNERNAQNNSNDDLSKDKRLEKMAKELSDQKSDLQEKYQQIQNEIVSLRSSINNSPKDTSLLTKKFQEFNQAQIDLGEKLTSLEKENSEIKKAQNTLSENISSLEKESKKIKEDNDDENSLKELYNHLYNQNERMKQTINKLSDENYSIGNKIIEMNSDMGEKEKKLKEIYEENYELKKKIKNLENEINNWKQKYENNMENSQRQSSRNEKNEQQINRLNSEISQLRESLNRLNSKNEEKKGFLSDNDNYKVKYGIIIIILMVIIYYAYKKCCGNEDNSNEVKPFKSSSQYSGYSGYGSYSNNFM